MFFSDVGGGGRSSSVVARRKDVPSSVSRSILPVRPLSTVGHYGLGFGPTRVFLGFFPQSLFSVSNPLEPLPQEGGTPSSFLLLETVK